MTLVIFGVGVGVFFLTVYGVVIAGGLQLTARDIDEQPELAAEMGLGDKKVQVKDITSKEF